jgi:hypothetical protein
MNKFYPLQLWLTSIGVAVVLLFLIGSINSQGIQVQAGDVEMFFLFIFFSLGFSLPIFAITSFVYMLDIIKSLSPLKVKAILNLIAIAGAFVTFLVINGSESFNWKGNRSGMIFSIIYSVSIVISSAIYKIKKRHNKQPIIQAS